MFRHSSCPSSAPSYSDAFMHDAAGSFSAGAAFPDGGNVGATFPPFAVATASSSSPPSYSPLPSSYYNIHRSTSLPLYHQLADALNSGSAFFSSSSPSPHQLPPPPPLSSSPSSSSGDLFEFTSSGPVRRVFSTGDLQGMNRTSPLCSLLSDDSCGQDGGGPFSQKVGRYSAEERKERIERYRVKRHQRNFNKKITYGCRKTLADSRPRVKGRFARNGEAEGEADEREASDNSYDYGRVIDPGNHSSGNSCLPGTQYNNDGTCSNGATAFVGGSDNGEWWWRVPGATAAAADEAELQRQVGFDVDEELWATLDDILSVNETDAYVGGRWGPAHEHEH